MASRPWISLPVSRTGSPAEAAPASAAARITAVTTSGVTSGLAPSCTTETGAFELREPSIHRVLPVRTSGHNGGHFAQPVFGQQGACPIDIRCADDHHDPVDERR